MYQELVNPGVMAMKRQTSLCSGSVSVYQDKTDDKHICK